MAARQSRPRSYDTSERTSRSDHATGSGGHTQGDRQSARYDGLAHRSGMDDGCRIDELVTAKRSQLDHTRRQLTVIGKRNKLRVIDLDGWGYDEVFRRLPAKLGKPSLFWHHNGEPYKTASGQFKRLVKSVDRQAQKQARETPEQAHSFRAFRFHDLRHRHPSTEGTKSGTNQTVLPNRKR
jgi:integrase/recombinase XerD